ncbi:unnamed protein product [Thelazia callipaeda]|uniref:ULP_PROTEASE domain-containing protein n=1 Tax=Thelazia callipaeda TaxID=103827 RepID=A0A0N5DAL1_THECL|nr:unnamed protein product [Thelazia callipaeda]
MNGCVKDFTSSSLSVREYEYKDVLEVDVSTEIICVRFPCFSLHISVGDLLCLAEGELLNGTIIDFYLNHIRCHLIQDSTLRIHIFPSLFWGNLKMWMRMMSAENTEAFTVEEIGSANEVLNPNSVQYWLQEEDIFDSDFLVIPVNEYNHWLDTGFFKCLLSLAIIFISCLTPQFPVYEPLIIMFDSQQAVELPCTEDVTNILRTFLFHTSKLSTRKENLVTKHIKTVIPKNLPQQENDVDCGLYILEYAQRFLLQPPIKDLSLYNEFDFSSHYPDFTVISKRQSIRSTLFTLCADSKKWSYFFDVEQ